MVVVLIENDKWMDSYKHASVCLKAQGCRVAITNNGYNLEVDGATKENISNILRANEDVGSFEVA